MAPTVKGYPTPNVGSTCPVESLWVTGLSLLHSFRLLSEPHSLSLMVYTGLRFGDKGVSTAQLGSILLDQNKNRNKNFDVCVQTSTITFTAVFLLRLLQELCEPVLIPLLRPRDVKFSCLMVACT